MPDQGKRVGFVVVWAPPFVAFDQRHIDGKGMFQTREEAERHARDLQQSYKSPWYQVAEVRLLLAPTTQVQVPDESGADLETRGEARGRWNLPGIDDGRT